jgi:hypothetical protein
MAGRVWQRGALWQLEAAAASTTGVTRATATEDHDTHAVEIEIEAETLAAAEWGATRALAACPAGIGLTWLPAGPAAEEALAKALGGEIDWRPGDLMPEDFWAL